MPCIECEPGVWVCNMPCSPERRPGATFLSTSGSTSALTSEEAKALPKKAAAGGDDCHTSVTWKDVEGGVEITWTRNGQSMTKFFSGPVVFLASKTCVTEASGAATPGS